MKDSRSSTRYSARSSDSACMAYSRHLEHQQVIEGRTAALGAVRSRHRPLQFRAEPLEVDQSRNALKDVALGRALPQPVVDVEEARLPSRHHPLR